MAFCSPAVSLCGVVVSIWGIIQLGLMGFFYKINSLALAEDLPGLESTESISEFYLAAENGYSMNAYNCWIAACLYIVTLLVSAHQFYLNNRSSVSM